MKTKFKDVLDGEIFKPIKGYESLYMISNMGRVLSLEKALNRNGSLYMRPAKILKTKIGTHGRYYVSLYGECNKNKFIHRLIAEAFIPNPNNKPEINHIDGNPLNNSLDNLEWCTRKENQNHAFKNGLCRYMPKNSPFISKPIIQLLNGKIIARYPSSMEAKRILGYATSNISNCLNGKKKLAYGYEWKYDLNGEAIDKTKL